MKKNVGKILKIMMKRLRSNMYTEKRNIVEATIKEGKRTNGEKSDDLNEKY